MIAAGGGDDAARARALATATAGATWPTSLPFLTHAREQEHVVVGREPEQDREHEQRHVGDDRLLGRRRAAPAPVSVWNTQVDDPVGGGDRDEVEARPRAAATRDRAERHARAAAARARRPSSVEERQAVADRGGPRRPAARCSRRRRHPRRCPRSAAGIVSLRRSPDERGRARRPAGALRGTTVSSAASPARSSDGRADRGDVAARAATASRSALGAARGVAAGPASTATTSGPLTPGPNAGGEPVVGLALGPVGARGCRRRAGRSSGPRAGTPSTAATAAPASQRERAGGAPPSRGAPAARRRGRRGARALAPRQHPAGPPRRTAAAAAARRPARVTSTIDAGRARRPCRRTGCR